MFAVAPTIFTPHEGQLLSITEGENGSITCTAMGFPVPTVVWQHSNGSSLSGGLMSGSPTITSTGVGNVTKISVDLIGTQVRRQIAGEYTCTAGNLISSIAVNIIVGVKSKSVS